MDENLTSVYFEDINTEVYGFSYHTAEIKNPLLEDIQVPLGSRIQILMAHGGDAAHLPINFNSLELSPFSYIALGHIHKPHVLSPDKMAYCGSPEPLDVTETGVHGFYYGEIHPVTRRVTTLQFLPAARIQYIPLAVNVTKDTTNGELFDRIAREIENRGRKIYTASASRVCGILRLNSTWSSLPPVSVSPRLLTTPNLSTISRRCLQNTPQI